MTAACEEKREMRPWLEPVTSRSAEGNVIPLPHVTLHAASRDATPLNVCQQHLLVSYDRE